MPAPSPPRQTKLDCLKIDLKFVFFLKSALGDSSEPHTLENPALRAVLVLKVGEPLK